LVAQTQGPNFKDVIRGQIGGLQYVESIELVLGQVHGSKVRSSASFGQRQAQLHDQDAGKQVAVEPGGLGAEDVGQDDVDAPVKIAAFGWSPTGPTGKLCN